MVHEAQPGPDVVQCDGCGVWVSFYELAEMIEEYLCSVCASGLDPDGPELKD